MKSEVRERPDQAWSKNNEEQYADGFFLYDYGFNT